MPLVSICIPTYKQVDLLRKCLQSVIDQDFDDYEIIISDDTPDDSVKRVVSELLKNRPFRYFKNFPSLGSPANWNKAISEAEGTYIKLLHHDDFFTQPFSLRIMLEHIQSQKADFIFCQTKIWSPKFNFSRIYSATPKQIRQINQNIEFLFFGNCIGAPSATLYRNDPCINYDERLVWLVDVDFYIMYINSHKLIYFIKQPLVCTTHGTEQQVTGIVENDINVQVKEHVLLYLKKINTSIKLREYAKFFEHIFICYNIYTYKKLIEIVPEASICKEFYCDILLKLNKHIYLKKLKYKLYNTKRIMPWTSFRKLFYKFNMLKK